MGWTFYNSSGQRLSTAATSIDVLDIDGATDIGAAIVDADLFIIDDGAGGTNRKTAASRIKTYVAAGAVTYEGGNTTEATTTSTSAVDLLSLTSLTIQTTEAALLCVSYRKSTGAADDTALGLKLNTTVTSEAVSGGLRVGDTTTSNVAQLGGSLIFLTPRVTNYTEGGAGFYGTYQTGGNGKLTNSINNPFQSAASPAVEITDVVWRGITDNASNTLGADESHAYSLAAS